MGTRSTFLERYLAGEHEPVWAEPQELGAAIREQPHHSDALAVAHETMWRVRHNTELVHTRLQRMGYEFWVPERAHILPSADTLAILAEIEGLRGPIPLSLRAFYEVVSSVDFRQPPKRLVYWQDVPPASTSELDVLGEEDPLVVASVEELPRVVRAYTPTQAKRVEFPFAPDEFHKANDSGGEDYHLWLPNPDADFRIEGMYEITATCMIHDQAGRSPHERTKRLHHRG
jgi:hypothetical protein